MRVRGARLPRLRLLILPKSFPTEPLTSENLLLKKVPSLQREVCTSLWLEQCHYCPENGEMGNLLLKRLLHKSLGSAEMHIHNLWRKWSITRKYVLPIKVSHWPLDSCQPRPLYWRVWAKDTWYCLSLYWFSRHRHEVCHCLRGFKAYKGTGVWKTGS